MKIKSPSSLSLLALETNAHRYSGKLLLRNEIDLHEKDFKEYLSKGLFTSCSAFIQSKFKNHCRRCENDKQSLIGLIDCEICKKAHLYCRNCIEMGRIIECEPLYEWTGNQPRWLSYVNPCSWNGTLSRAQQTAADTIKRAIIKVEKELLVWAVCGAGKTEMLFPGITKALENGKRICITTPRTDVVRELLPRIQQAFSEVAVEGLYGSSPDKQGSSQLLIATTHQLLRFKNAFDIVIIDEVDAFPYHADASLIKAVNKSKRQESTTIYLTATPRHEHRRQISRKKLPHVFVPIRFHGHPLPVPTFKSTFSLQKDINQGNLPAILQTWLQKREKPERQLLIFVPTIEQVEQLTKTWRPVFKDIRIIKEESQFQSVHAEDGDREDKITQFRKGNIIILITTTILERGVTFPSIDVVVLDAGHDVFDEAALVQISGRAGRSHQDPNGEVLFLHDGKTNAMVDAVQLIKKMNKRGNIL